MEAKEMAKYKSYAIIKGIKDSDKLYKSQKSPLSRELKIREEKNISPESKEEAKYKSNAINKVIKSSG